MLEQVTDAIVLDKEFVGDAHVRVHLLTKALGRITAKATSARKITSKLNAHLEPLTVSAVRLVQKNHLPQIIDALRKDVLPLQTLPLFKIVKELAAEYEPDHPLYAALIASRGGGGAARHLLSILGYDPQFAACSECDAAPTHFSLTTISFFCANCFTHAGDCVML